MRLERLPAGESVAEHVAVGEFERAAGGQAAGEPRDFDSGFAKTGWRSGALCRRLLGWDWSP